MFNSETPLPFTSAGRPDTPVFSSSKETSLIVVEKKNVITASVAASSSRSMHDAGDTSLIQSADVTASDAGPAAGTDTIKTTGITSSAQLVAVSFY